MSECVRPGWVMSQPTLVLRYVHTYIHKLRDIIA